MLFDMKVLVVDNYDSFTYNLVDYLIQTGLDCEVVRDSIEHIDMNKIHAIVFSPGPGHPNEHQLMNLILEQYYDKKPILGICLGMQAIGLKFGAQLTHASVPMHGKTSLIQCKKASIFNTLKEEILVMRYHSLLLENIPEATFEVLARTETNEAMAIRHRGYPMIGLQFHPESILTPDGLQIIQNWVSTIKAALKYS